MKRTYIERSHLARKRFKTPAWYREILKQHGYESMADSAEALCAKIDAWFDRRFRKKCAAHLKNLRRRRDRGEIKLFYKP